MTELPAKRGGSRPGAGRKRGTGTYGEPTEPLRIPVSLLPAVRAILKTGGKSPEHPGMLSPAPLPAAVALPFYTSRVAAGLPSPADDHQGDGVDLNDRLIRHPGTTFLVEVQGDSMTGAGIHHGDLLVVDRSLEPKPGKIVIAVVNGELTVKRLDVDERGVRLLPENPAYEPIVIEEGMDLMIWGVVLHVVHSF
jgi:DNA polymerase V